MGLACLGVDVCVLLLAVFATVLSGWLIGARTPTIAWATAFAGVALGLYASRSLYRQRLRLHVLDDAGQILAATTFAGTTVMSVRVVLGHPVPVADSHSFTKAQVVSVLQANPNSVKLSPKNNVLNLAQQLFAAQLNINRGVVPPPSVTSAISTAIASLTFTFDAGGRVTAISSTLSASQIGALVETLSSFNEGTLTSGGHCGGTSRSGGKPAPPVTKGTISEATPRAGATLGVTSLPFTGLSLLSTVLVSIAFVIGGMTLRRSTTLRSL